MNEQFDQTETLECVVETAEDISARKSIYGEIKRALIARGIPAEEIAFIHDYPTPAKKSQAFAEVNTGKIRVLIGSTEKMGVGSNFQERLVGLHHLSPCFRPADIQQREGRILRQGNIFPEVHICTYVTENSFDAFMWGLVESKARFISQIMAGEVTARTAEDVDQLVMTAAQIKAIASGNPQILEKVAVEVELTKLERLYSAWSASRQRLRRQMESLPSHLDSIVREIAGHRKAIATRNQHERHDFTIELRRDVSSELAGTFTDRERAGSHLRQLCLVVAHEARSRGKIISVLGRYRGFEIIVRASGRQLDALSSLFSETDLFLRAGDGEPGYSINFGESDAGFLQSMDAQLRGLEGRLEKALAAQAELERRQQQITAELKKGFEPAARYEELKASLNTLNRELTRAGVEIEASPELSTLDEEAFRHVESGVSIHQILSLTDQSVASAEIEEIAFTSQVTITQAATAIESAGTGTAAADVRLVRNSSKADQAFTNADAENESENAFFTPPESDQAGRADAVKRRTASKSAAASRSFQQMSFNWI